MRQDRLGRCYARCAGRIEDIAVEIDVAGPGRRDGYVAGRGAGETDTDGARGADGMRIKFDLARNILKSRIIGCFAVPCFFLAAGNLFPSRIRRGVGRFGERVGGVLVGVGREVIIRTRTRDRGRTGGCRTFGPAAAVAGRDDAEPAARRFLMDRNGLIARSDRPGVAVMGARQIRGGQPIDRVDGCAAHTTGSRIGRHGDGAARILVDRRGLGAAAACLRDIVDQQRAHAGRRIIEIFHHQIVIGVVGDGDVGVAAQHRDAAVAGVEHMAGQRDKTAADLHRCDADLPRRHVEIDDEIGIRCAVELLHPGRAACDQLFDLGFRCASDGQAVARPAALYDAVDVDVVGIDGDPVTIQIDHRGRLRQHAGDLRGGGRDHAARLHLGMRIGVGVVGTVG